MAKYLFKLSILLVISLFTTNTQAQTCGKWVMGYLPTYQQNNDGTTSYLTSTEYSKLTHLMSFGPYAKSDGSLDMVVNTSTSLRLAGAVAAAHANNVPVILSISSWVTDYLPALQNTSIRNILINNILALFDTYHYDGIDIDLEPIMSPYVAGIQTSNPDYITFINMLYDSLQTRNSTFLNRKPLLTVAANGYAAPVLSQLQAKFDMINIMTYDLAGVYPGWVSWHDSPVYSGGNTMPSTGNPMPSVDGEMQICLSNGISPAKLGIGVSFDAFRWKGGSGTSTGGVTAPMQAYTTDPTWTRFTYSEFYQNYYNASYYHYDNNAQMSYLSIDNATDANDEFWSYNDKTSIEDKMKYVWSKNLGGVIIWELKGGYIPGSQIPQLNYIQAANCQLQTSTCKICGPVTIEKQ